MGIEWVYDWQAALALLALVAAITIVGKKLVFLVPALAEARAYNLAQDAKKLAQAKYPVMVQWTNRVGLACNLFLYMAVAPFVVSFAAKPAWQYIIDVVAVLMFYDFFYYLMHRFLFHGKGYFRKVHGIHHQARSPTYIDALYVHPLETFLGLSLFTLAIAVVGYAVGGMNVFATAVCIVIYTQINVVNHTRVDLPRFPFKTLSWITAKHAVHHENMHRGNYASITLLFDKVFGTFDR
ncbi:MAG TPA: sterol desaturase family protein [Pseudomonadales bacterium]